VLIQKPACKYLSIVTKNWRQPKCPSVGKWKNKLWYIHIMEFYSAIKRSELLLHTSWMKIKCILLSERSQTQKATNCMIPFMWNSGKDGTIGTEKQVSGCQWLGLEGWGNGVTTKGQYRQFLE
jgi:hypothetical protein